MAKVDEFEQKGCCEPAGMSNAFLSMGPVVQNSSHDKGPGLEGDLPAFALFD